ncbi:predicted protein [Plenodomus lingam JN3]|uniref:Uncharacterized protein n=1 Tax=Leptosphaeria maculans (strain JN3 / isolate v23.1.3 / race Av1-4-5-6-7-8) TaxID=985895 RepID=E4ZFW1_LEPMJ|nr:predicted protein [Plenodomus lingam JN3]CBX90181.1 predicted protein [Plenodomus lingam JN3]
MKLISNRTFCATIACRNSLTEPWDFDISAELGPSFPSPSAVPCSLQSAQTD